MRKNEKEGERRGKKEKEGERRIKKEKEGERRRKEYAGRKDLVLTDLPLRNEALVGAHIGIT